MLFIVVSHSPNYIFSGETGFSLPLGKMNLLQNCESFSSIVCGSKIALACGFTLYRCLFLALVVSKSDCSALNPVICIKQHSMHVSIAFLSDTLTSLWMGTTNSQFSSR